MLVLCLSYTKVEAQGGVTYYLDSTPVDSKNILTTTPPPNSRELSGKFANGQNQEWSTKLTGDIKGGVYSFSIWLAAVGSSCRVDIILNQRGKETTLATWDKLTTTDTEKYQLVKRETAGATLNAGAGDRLVLRITNTGTKYPDWVHILEAADGQQSSITISPK